MSGKWDSVKDVVAKIAPGLATALGGPLAGVATGMILAKLGMKPGEEDKAIEMLQTDPDAILKLKLAEIDFQKFMREAGIKEQELDVRDRVSARLMATAVGNRAQALLALMYTVGYLTMVFGVMADWLGIPETGQTLFAGLIGVMSAAQIQILNFYFGSSSGSARKDETIREMNKA